MDIVKISLLGVGSVILGLLLKETKPEYICFLSLGVGIVILGLAVGKIQYLIQTLSRIQDSIPVDAGYLTTLVKMVGITYVGQFASGICKDAGHPTTGAQIELFCRLSVLTLSMPILVSLLEMIREYSV